MCDYFISHRWGNSASSLKWKAKNTGLGGSSSPGLCTSCLVCVVKLDHFYNCVSFCKLSPNQMTLEQKQNVSEESWTWWTLCATGVTEFFFSGGLGHWLEFLTLLLFPSRLWFKFPHEHCFVHWRVTQEGLLARSLDTKRACVFLLPFSISTIAMRRSCLASQLVVEENRWHVEQSQAPPEKPSLDWLNPADDTWAKQMLIVYAAKLWRLFIIQHYQGHRNNFLGLLWIIFFSATWEC